jgi:hypothetical protein
MKQMYDAQNAALTLGFLVLEHAQKTMDLLLRENSLDKIQSYEMFLDWLDGQLAGYRSDMKLKFLDKKTNKIAVFENYESAMILIYKMLKETEGAKNDKQERQEYVYWLNRRAELLASCYESIRLTPERKAGEERWEEDAQTQNLQEEPVEDLPGIPAEEEEVWFVEEGDKIESEQPNPNH